MIPKLLTYDGDTTFSAHEKRWLRSAQQSPVSNSPNPDDSHARCLPAHDPRSLTNLPTPPWPLGDNGREAWAQRLRLAFLWHCAKETRVKLWCVLAFSYTRGSRMRHTLLIAWTKGIHGSPAGGSCYTAGRNGEAVATTPMFMTSRRPTGTVDSRAHTTAV